MYRKLLLGAGLFMGMANASANIIQNPGFELTPFGYVDNTSLTSNNNWPKNFEQWGPDWGEVVASYGELSPMEGEKMWRFMGQSLNNPGSQRDVYTHIDLSAWGEEIDQGNVTINLGGFFTAANDAARIGFSVRPYYTADIGSYNKEHSGERGVSEYFGLDDDLLSWEEFSYEFLLPATTRRVMFGMHMQAGADLQDQFADNMFASLSVGDSNLTPVSEQGTLGMALAGLIGLGLIRRRKLQH